MELSVIDDTVAFTGTLNNLTTPWKEFDKKNNTGHFIPIQLPDICRGNAVTVKGLVGGDNTVTIDDDLLLVVRLENLTGTGATLEMNDAELMKLDFSALIPTGEDAYDAAKTDFGRFGKREEITENFAIEWDGIRATATGKLKKITAELHTKYEKLLENQYYLPIGMSAWYFDGVPKQAGAEGASLKSLTDKDIVFDVADSADLNKLRKIVYNGLTVMELDMSQMTLA